MEASRLRVRNVFRDLIHGQLKPWDRKQLYEYPSLGEDQVRVLELHPGLDTANIVVTLRPVDFSADDIEPLYEAISYTWGSTEGLKRITVIVRNTITRQRYLYVTKNCWEALSALRYRDRPRTLWIDAICINQSDDAEKTQQVAKMARIYRSAARVTVWLGPALEDTKVAFDWIQKASTHVSLDPQTYQLSLLSDDSRWMENGGEALIDEDEVCALAKLLSYSWFERVWIWQEIRLGYSKAVLKCGRHEIAWHKFCAANRYHIGKSARGPWGGMLINRSDMYIRQLLDMRRRSPLQLIDFMRSSECKDRRDRLFAVHGMLDAHGQAVFGQPDYFKHWHAVYTGLCVNYARIQSELDFLNFVTEHQELSLPSWVPDWTPGDSLEPIDGRAGGFSRSAVLEIHDRTLKVKGRIVTTVDHVMCSTLRGNWADRSQDALKEGLSKFLQSIVTKLGMSADSVNTTALSYALTAGQVREAYHPAGREFPRAEELVELFQMSASPNIPSNLEEAAFHMAFRCWGRSLLLMADGKFGLGPSHTQAGDRISVFLGCRPPMVLRPTTDGEHHVVGPAYVRGLMEGQAFLGPLPPAYSSVWYQSLGQLWPAFRDEASGAIRLTDPRLPELSAGWQYIGGSDSLEEWAFENVKTGEKRMHGFDPRWDAEALEANDIRLNTITLV